MSGEPFHRCTHTALSPKGEIYVSDGYGNARVHKYSPDGKLLMSWGEPGTDPGQFNIVHNICTDADGWVYVADRENHRVQVFDGNGKYETQWNNLHRPCGLYMPYTHHPVCYIGELGPVQPVNRNSPNLGPRVSIVDHQGKLLSRIGDPARRHWRRPRFSDRTALRVDFARRPLCRRGVVDVVAAIFPGQAAPGADSLIAEIREGALNDAVAASADGDGRARRGDRTTSNEPWPGSKAAARCAGCEAARDEPSIAAADRSLTASAAEIAGARRRRARPHRSRARKGGVRWARSS